MILRGTFALLRLALRRDRWLLPAWIALFALMASSSATATARLYPSSASRVMAAETLNATAALVAIYGRIYDPTSLGAIALIKLTAFGSALVAILMTFVVIRHTRAEEESGRLELVSAGEVGRDAPLAAAMLLAAGTCIALGAFTALGLRGAGLPWPGSISFGLGWALTGLTFVSLAGVTAQLTVGSRAARGLALACVAVAYALRAIGDLAERGPGWPSWLSPIGWAQQLRPFAGDRFWVAALPTALVVLAVPIAFVLRAGRDLGSGLLAERPGPSRGTLSSTVALAWRLQRPALGAWAAGTIVMAFALGSVAHRVLGLASSQPMRHFFATLGGAPGWMEGFLAAEIGLFGTVISAYGVSACARLRSYEISGQAEILLSTPTTRGQFAASHFGVSLAGASVLLASAGAAVGLGHGAATNDFSQVPRMIGAGVAQVPAVWVMTSIVFLLFGWAPRAVPASWGILVAFVVCGEFGVLWRLPPWLLNASPFAHSPRLPGGSLHPGSVVGLLATAALLASGGLVGWRRRDVMT